jgi:hypothetical protein
MEQRILELECQCGREDRQRVEVGASLFCAPVRDLKCRGPLVLEYPLL